MYSLSISSYFAVITGERIMLHGRLCHAAVLEGGVLKKNLAHLGDGVVEHAARVVGSFTDQLHLPRSGGQTQLRRVHVHHLLRYLHKNGLTGAPPVDRVRTEEIYRRKPRTEFALFHFSKLTQFISVSSITE